MAMPRDLQGILLEAGVVSRDELDAAVTRAERDQEKLPLVLFDMNLIEERPLAELIARQTGLELLEPLPVDVPTWVYRRLPGPIAQSYKAVPVRQEDRTLTVAMLDPTDRGALEVLAAATDLKIVPVVAVRSSLQKLLDSLYPLVDIEATVISERNREPGLDTMAIASARSTDIEARLDEITAGLRDLQAKIAALREQLKGHS